MRVKYTSLVHFILILALLGIAMSAQAATKAMVLKGGRVGNGGGLVVCRTPSPEPGVPPAVTSVELLDFYESRTHRGIAPDFSGLTGNWKNRARQLVERLNALSPFRRDLYSRWITTFESESLYLTDVEFSLVPDSAHVAVPIGCAFEQGAVQIAPRFTAEKRYFINSALWNVMDENQRAGLVLHELVYREALAYGHTDSVSVRYVTSYSASARLAMMTPEEWITMLRQARFEMTDVPVPGGFKSKIDISRLWALPAGERVPLYEMNDRAMIFLGRCRPDCGSFLAYPEMTETSYALHPNTTEFGSNGYEFSAIRAPNGPNRPSIFALLFVNGVLRSVRKDDELEGLELPQPFDIKKIREDERQIMARAFHVSFDADSKELNFFRGPEVMISRGNSASYFAGDDCSPVTVGFDSDLRFSWAERTEYEVLSRNPLTGLACSSNGDSPLFVQNDSQWLIRGKVPVTRAYMLEKLEFVDGLYASGGSLAMVSTIRPFQNDFWFEYDGTPSTGLPGGEIRRIEDTGAPYIARFSVIGQIAARLGRRSPEGHPESTLILRNQEIELHASGSPRSAVVEGGSWIVYVDGSEELVSERKTLNFDEYGHVIR